MADLVTLSAESRANLFQKHLRSHVQKYFFFFFYQFLGIPQPGKADTHRWLPQLFDVRLVLTSWSDCWGLLTAVVRAMGDSHTVSEYKGPPARFWGNDCWAIRVFSHLTVVMFGSRRREQLPSSFVTSVVFCKTKVTEDWSPVRTCQWGRGHVVTG